MKAPARSEVRSRPLLCGRHDKEFALHYEGEVIGHRISPISPEEAAAMIAWFVREKERAAEERKARVEKELA